MKNKKRIIYILIPIVIILLIAILIYIKTDSIKMVKTILKPKYSSIICLNNNCSSVVATEKNDKTNTITLIHEGKMITKYTQKDKETKTPISIKKNYFITMESKNSDDSSSKYSINDKDGKVLYTTENYLISVNDKYILERGDKYTLLNYKGEEVFKDISEYNLYNNNKIIEIVTENKYIIYDEEENTILDGYKIDNEITDLDNNTLYLVVKNIEDSYYRCFNADKLRFVGDSFENYSVSDNGELVVTKSENGSKIIYKVNSKGKQKRLSTTFSKVDEVTKINKKLDENKYYLYSTSVYTNDQKNVLVDNKTSKEIGTYNLETNKFKKIYSYSEDENNFYSSVVKLNSKDDNNYLEVSCSEKICGETKLFIVNMKDNKVEFSLENSDITLQYYIQYKNGYKVVKYSNLSESDYNGKYVLFDDKNKEIAKSDYEIIIIDETVEFGPTLKESMILYSTKDKKIINNSTANILELNNEKYYIYQDKDNNTIILNSTGEEKLKVKIGQNLKYSEDSLIYIDNDIVNMYDKKFKYKTYKLSENEEISNGTTSLLPYEHAIFINNTKENYFKVINFNGLKVRKIKGVQISNIYKKKDGGVYIITKKSEKKKTTYGLYLAQ